MLPVEGYPGQWVCVKNSAHLFDEDGVVPEPYRKGEKRLQPMGPNPLIDRAAPFWLSHLGLEGPISTVPQSNVGDGSMMHGPSSKGGGSKSGRKRKKGKGGLKFTDTPWGEEGGTCR